MDYQLIDQLQNCHSFLTKLEERITALSNLSKEKSTFVFELSKLQDQQSRSNLKTERNGYIKLLLAFLFAPLLVIFWRIGVKLQYVIDVDPTILALIIFFLAGIADIILPVLIGSHIASKKAQKRAEQITKLESFISDIRETQDINKKEIDKLLNSPDADMVEYLIPPDYREAVAVERFIYYFRNGHAETMKEAVREYDNYKHNLKMEYAAEKSAMAAAESALQAAKTAKNVEEIQFWTMLNTFINVSRK
ncbi:MAG: hypothetical protein IKU40_01410 [Clostridia bacterium]|nr:hypothetical protein [Clostridia bacterium]